MGNSYSSKKKTTSQNLQKIRNGVNKKNVNKSSIPNSATGRHSLGFLNRDLYSKSPNDTNQIFHQSKNKIIIRESLRKSNKINNIKDHTRQSRILNNNNSLFDSEYFIDYNKIMFEIFERLCMKKNTPNTEEICIKENIEFKKNLTFKSNTKVSENYINKNLDNNISGNKEDANDYNNKNENINSNSNYIHDYSKKIEFNYRKENNNPFENIWNKDEKDLNVKSFITANSKENTEDFFVAKKSKNINSNFKENYEEALNIEERTLPIEHDIHSDVKKEFLYTENIKENLCFDINCKFYSEFQKKVKTLDKNSNNEECQTIEVESIKNNYDSFKQELKVNNKKELERIEKEFKNYDDNKILNLKYINLKQEKLEIDNKIHSFNLDNDINFTLQDESTINFNSKIYTPKKENENLGIINTLDITEEKNKDIINLNSLIKLFNNDSNVKSTDSKLIYPCDSSQKIIKFDNEFIETLPNNSNNELNKMNKSTVSSSNNSNYNNLKEICINCISKLNLSPKEFTDKIISEEKKLAENDIKENPILTPKIQLIFNNQANFSSNYDFEEIINVKEIDEKNMRSTNNNNLRYNYISKLIFNNIWLPNNKPKTHHSLIIFDWDDTLLCTTFLTPNGIFYDSLKIDKKDLEKIMKLESLAYKILKSSIEKGDTYIVTNAAPGWVEYSAKRFYPKVYPLLNKLTIISARGEFEKKYPGDSRQWKILTFLKILKIIDTKLLTNFICLGDSLIEMEAAHIFASKFTNIFIKTVKFRENPTPEELFKQLQLILDQYDNIFSSVKNLTIKIERKAKNIINKTNYTSFQNLSNFDISQIRNSLPNNINKINK